MASGQIQGQKQVQKLSLQQILVAELLQLPVQELGQRFNVELERNPALEEGPADNEPSVDNDWEGDEGNDVQDGEYNEAADYRTEDDVPDYLLNTRDGNPDSPAMDWSLTDAKSFFDVLKEQLGMQDVTERQRELAEFLIGLLDDDGLFRKDLQWVADNLAIYHNMETTEEELAKALELIQSFDPAGIGARSLQECLTIQLRRKPQTEARDLLQQTIACCWDDVTNNRRTRVCRRLALDEAQYDAMMDELKKLNPRPGLALGELDGKNMNTIIPDFVVSVTDDNEILISLNNEQVPELHVSRTFLDLCEEYKGKGKDMGRQRREELAYMKQRVDAAQGFIDAVRQRQQTLLKTMQAIVDLQRAFFLEGDEAKLQPIKLETVARMAGVDISTVSRVNNSKYVETRYGIYPLRFFYGGSIVSESGDEISTRQVKAALQQLVGEEDARHPLTDEKLALLLKQRGLPISRRTVSKYREELGVPESRLRRK